MTMTRVTAAFLLGLFPSALAAQSSELRLGGLYLGSHQNLLGGTGHVHATGTLKGAELLARSEAAGVYARYLTGEVGQESLRGPDGRYRLADVRLMLGPPAFSLEGGYTMRSRSGSLGKDRDNLVRGGIRSMVWLGPSGFSLNLWASVLLRPDQHGGGKRLGIVGWEGLSGLTYQAPRGIPLYLMLGFRYERLRTETESPPVKREELTAIVFGGGLRHLGFHKPAGGTPPSP